LKAVDPVIAVLILIAIAVIAGVFVLRQFLTFAGQAGQQFLQIEHVAFTKQTDPFGTKMTITLDVKVRNIGDRQVEILDVEVRDANWKASEKVTDWGKQRILLNPGDSWSFSAQVLTDEPYTATWETGTSHPVTIYYKVAGNQNLQSVSATGTVS